MRLRDRPRRSGPTRSVARAVALATTLALCCAGSSAAQEATGTISGASLATCEPDPCLTNTTVETVTLPNVSDDDGTSSTRTFGVDRPHNLRGLAPAVLVFYGGGQCGVVPASRFPQVAVANRFIVVYMAVPCGRSSNWEERNVDSTGTSTPDDEPYVTAVVNELTRCPGQCVDPQRLYAVGMSSGGSMVADIMCDPQNSPLFRGYMIDSSSLQVFNGSPHCPSSNRNFFVMLALSNYGADAGLYYDTAPNPHLDVPTFAGWAASRLGCSASPVSGTLGSPFASTLTFSYAGPCAYVSPGSLAVLSLGIGNGSHGWACQDSDSGATAHQCTVMPNPPGLDAKGLPQTNGLFTEAVFWNFVAQGLSSSASAPTLDATAPAPVPNLGVFGLDGSPAVVGRGYRRWLALGDDYAAGTSDPPYLAGTDTRADRCKRSSLAYASVAAARLGIVAPLVSVDACAGATVADFYRADSRDHVPPQLSWLTTTTSVVTLMAGWNDTSMPATIAGCGQAAAACRAGAHAFDVAISSLGSSSESPRSLRHLFGFITSAAPRARVIAMGYPRPFPAFPPAQCRLRSSALRLTRSAMSWIDADVRRLDLTIQAAAAATHITYVRRSYNALAGHELCTHRPFLDSAFDPSRLGQATFAALLSQALT